MGSRTNGKPETTKLNSSKGAVALLLAATVAFLIAREGSAEEGLSNNKRARKTMPQRPARLIRHMHEILPTEIITKTLAVLAVAIASLPAIALAQSAPRNAHAQDKLPLERVQ